MTKLFRPLHAPPAPASTKLGRSHNSPQHQLLANGNFCILPLCSLSVSRKGTFALCSLVPASLSRSRETSCGSANAGICVEDTASWLRVPLRRCGDSGDICPTSRGAESGFRPCKPVTTSCPNACHQHPSTKCETSRRISDASYKAGSATSVKPKKGNSVCLMTPMPCPSNFRPLASKCWAARSVGQRNRIWLPGTCKS